MYNNFPDINTVQGLNNGQFNTIMFQSVQDLKTSILELSISIDQLKESLELGLPVNIPSNVSIDSPDVRELTNISKYTFNGVEFNLVKVLVGLLNNLSIITNNNQ